MKKYEKPRVLIEKFSLSKHIAACAFDMTNLLDAEANCFAVGDADFDKEGMTLFTEAMSTCDVYKNFFDDYCYTNSSSGTNVFNS